MSHVYFDVSYYSCLNYFYFYFYFLIKVLIIFMNDLCGPGTIYGNVGN